MSKNVFYKSFRPAKNLLCVKNSLSLRYFWGSQTVSCFWQIRAILSNFQPNFENVCPKMVFFLDKKFKILGKPVKQIILKIYNLAHTKKIIRFETPLQQLESFPQKIKKCIQNFGSPSNCHLWHILVNLPLDQ